MPFKKNRFKVFILSVVISVVILSGVAAGYYFINKYIDGINKTYEAKINEYKLKENQNKKKLYVPRTDIKYNTVLNEEMFEQIDAYSSLPMDLYMNSSDFGKLSVIDLKAGVPVMKVMMVKDKIPNDIRQEEFNMLYLQSNLTKDEFVDIRLCFPNGTDFIVVSKKKIQDMNLKQNTLWLWLNERETATISSAIVDAYLHKGSKLYVTKYVEPRIQMDAFVNYPVNLDVLSIIQSDPNIVSRAGLELNSQLRTALNEQLGKLAVEAIANVDQGVNQEISGSKQNIEQQAQQTASTGASGAQSSSQQTQNKPGASVQKTNDANKSTSSGSDKNGFFN